MLVREVLSDKKQEEIPLVRVLLRVMLTYLNKLHPLFVIKVTVEIFEAIKWPSCLLSVSEISIPFPYIVII